MPKYKYEVILKHIDGKVDILEPCETMREAKNSKHYWDKIYTDVTIREVDHE
jgi:hypothetical protein